MADTTPESDQLDLSSAEVATLTNITAADDEDGKETMEAQKEEPASTKAAKGKPEDVEAAGSAEGAEQRAEKPTEEATTKSSEADEAASAGGRPAAESASSKPTAEEPTEEDLVKNEEPDLTESAAAHPAADSASSEQQLPSAQKSKDAVTELSPPAASAAQQDTAQPQSRGPVGTEDDVPEMKASKGKESSAAQTDKHTRPEAAVSADAAAGSKLNGAVEPSEGTAASKSPTDTAARPAGQLPMTSSEAAKGALEAVALPGKAPFDPLGMDAAEEGLPAPEVRPYPHRPPSTMSAPLHHLPHRRSEYCADLFDDIGYRKIRCRSCHVGQCSAASYFHMQTVHKPLCRYRHDELKQASRHNMHARLPKARELPHKPLTLS